MGLYKRGKIWWTKFQISGREVRVSTGCRSKEKAKIVEARIRDQIALGNWGILERTAAPTVAEFINASFVPHVNQHYPNKRTRAYYLFGARQLLQSNIAGVQLDQITSEHTTRYVAEHAGWTGSGINQAFRTLRQVLSLALEWKKIAAKPRIRTVSENRRERVLTDDEEEKYLAACPEPWRTHALIMLDLACRPEELRRLAWEDINWPRRSLSVRYGKSPAARRTLTMSSRVMDALEPIRAEGGWLWPSRRSASGHIEHGHLWNQHSAALKISGVAPFDPYSLRHTCLTRMGMFVELPTLKVIAGHSQIEMTMRYVHPTQDSVEEAFRKAESRYKSRQRSKFKIIRESPKTK